MADVTRIAGGMAFWRPPLLNCVDLRPALQERPFSLQFCCLLSPYSLFRCALGFNPFPPNEPTTSTVDYVSIVARYYRLGGASQT